MCALAAGVGVGVALAGSGGLDPSFGTGGTTVLERHVSTYPTPTRLAAGGKVVVVTTSEGVITVSRLLADGAPDPTFDGDGIATIESTGFPSAHALAIQPDGKILLIGFTNIGASSEDATVWRLKADGGSGAANGALDPTFGSGGVVQLAPFAHTVGLAVAVQPDGKIVTAGRGFDTTGPNVIAVWRLTETGSLDPTFDTDGVAGINDTSEDSVNAIALAPDGKILLAGTTELSPAPRDAVVWRLKANGGAGGLNEALDPTFDTDGQADFDGGGNDQAEDVALQPDGKILLAGTSVTAGKAKATVWRVKPNGGSGVTNNALDPTFDTDGVALIDGGGSAFGSALALQPDGKILLAGSAQVGASPSTALLWRLLSDGGTGAVNGALDPTFGAGGATAVNTGASAGAGGLALQPDRRIVVAGGNFNVFNGSLLVFRALGDPFSVNVTKSGAGSGSVQSSPQGIACGASCSGPFDDGSQVTLTATAAAGSAFAGWSGAGCSGTGACTLTMSADQTVTATFNALPTTAPPPPKAVVTKPTISAVSASNTIFRVGGSSTPLTGRASAKRHKQGTVFAFRLDQAATVKIAIQVKARGRRVSRRCVANSRRLRHKPRCTRTMTVKTLVRSAHAGLNKVPFSGRISGKALAPGSYRAVFTAADSAGVSPSKTLSFTIVRR
jgi:uncharacterized delta-60 repeat protein